ncbi:hypothetical protein HY844_01250 [Candidatus Berkelbacteria bacterium]|nr:hypothetical protein [Candidatus Berkelbacteria bacterium]
MSKKFKRTVAEVISFITNPALVVVASLAVITIRYISSSEQYWNWLAVAIGLLLGPSSLYIVLMWLKEREVDIDITNREDRIVPLLLTTVGAVIGGYLLQQRVGNSSLLLLSNTLVAMLVLLTIVTFVWKISLHASTFMAAVSLVVVFRGFDFAWLYLAILPIAWARFNLRQHTPAQVIVGALSGVLITFSLAIILN